MGFFTADFCDTCKEGIQVLGPGFSNFGGKKKMKGSLVTVKLNENNQELIRVLDEAGQGRVVVVDVQGVYVAVVGENLMKKALKNGWSGFVINGYVRDVHATKEIGVGLWALGTCPRKCPDLLPGFVDHTVEFGGVKFEPGAYVYADMDGVIVSKEALI
ncbi:ribonuclease E activity regulator RraA [Sulfurospirillum sp. T05]|uniref:4-hydroxy-4-methyl-2-oxoglutarate aldolase n=1 Tax=Sulfurospirillum tamanense TaxID=2813362 RepID=A0ABS2WTG0_9BACT|nr:ribonuclease E activity regulator RraA [Sulfurospirillum tamanensis]MBN2964873.1 ribonuclease E activity regulator RraA [Sulfurospirillum tamanensis]